MSVEPCIALRQPQPCRGHDAVATECCSGHTPFIPMPSAFCFLHPIFSRELAPCRTWTWAATTYRRARRCLQPSTASTTTRTTGRTPKSFSQSGAPALYGQPSGPISRENLSRCWLPRAQPVAAVNGLRLRRVRVRVGVTVRVTCCASVPCTGRPGRASVQVVL